ncbi:MAG: alcohol dehydrogenase catalytic domain-containing protein [Armatimonadetes bacterium]|nr:alcohol dehydrogenase catalytic domain-containing protein [Armatimonadota bacterium]NIM23702.1 alcohol dehydrogenase catalytic domain-containing protein [Armatimonadota bacterium]NIM67579.1 alcohol dehydrogenase catalytic domain-containing protein [Armatimonadota bacterium]NIM76102.1 alcohol dehydrogenase catalytic domain-containing protein [Armatimonadota bacterium]NIN05785.1 alcohol dehydrogenase catalytic domain-containing protein [Armatimonadota bacterium]
MSAKLEAYQKAEEPLPKKHLAWELYGAGMENFGRQGKAVSLPLPKPGPNELLARIDSLGLCFSDVKIIKAGGDHPRLAGRDLAQDPVVIGHEVSVTIVQVGKDLQERFRVGQRFVIQADVYSKGKQVSFGYAIRGGAAQYCLLGEEMHSAEAGSYLIPVLDSTGYSEAALTEPWACVERAYHIRARPAPRPNGLTWIIGLAAADLGNYMLGEGFDYRGGPRRVMMTEMVGPVASMVRDHAFRMGFAVEETVVLSRFLPILEKRRNVAFDDIILLGKPRRNLIERLIPHLVKGGHLGIVCPDLMEQKVQMDLGRVHYDFIHCIGTATSVAMDAYRGRRWSALTETGAAWFIGAGGPMGQMHLQRTLEREQTPRVILATDTDESRLEVLKSRFSSLAEERGTRLIITHADSVTRRLVNHITDNDGFTHIILLAPFAELAEEAWQYLGESGIFNIFAGVARGTKAKLRISPVCTRDCRLVGSTGSKIEDLRFVLAETEAGRLATDRVVAAIGGISAVREGLTGAAEGKFPGKVVIYPQLDFPLTAISELEKSHPAVAEKLEGGRFWNRQAEAALLEQMLK